MGGPGSGRKKGDWKTSASKKSTMNFKKEKQAYRKKIKSGGKATPQEIYKFGK
jgi:hypothetical protein